jgi:Zn-dependent M28 family amino/carboxypeptidase
MGRSARALVFIVCLSLLIFSCSKEDSQPTTPTVPDTPGPTADPAIVALVSKISDTAMTTTILSLQQFGSRWPAAPNHDLVAAWLKGRFLSVGMTTVDLDTFPWHGMYQKNVVATIPGTSTPGEEIIIGGHYDSWSRDDTLNAPGADDNASGTAAVIEIARVLKEAGYQPKHTMRFVAFACEEKQPSGSSHFAADARAAQRNIKLVMNFDMVGYPSAPPNDSAFTLWSQDVVAVQGDSIARVYSAFKPRRENASGADEGSFLDQHYNRTLGYSELYLPTGTGWQIYPYIHSSNDTYDKLNMKYAREIVKAALAMLLIEDR